MIGAAIFFGCVVVLIATFFFDAMEDDVFRYCVYALVWGGGALLYLHWCNVI